MRRRQLLRRVSALMVAFVLISVCMPSTLAAGYIQTGEGNRIKTIISQMTTQQKLTQLMMPSFINYCPTDLRWNQIAPNDLVTITDLPAEIADFVSEYGFGGALLNGDTCSDNVQAARLIDQLQTANASSGNVGQLLMGLDQEGGVISRLRNATRTPGNMALAATGDVECARTVGRLLGEEIRTVGFHIDMAPVVDVNNNPLNPVINLRSFSDDAETVSRFAQALMDGLHESGAAVCIKHFPGHGNTASDSHTRFPRIDATMAELERCELIPFARCIEAGADCVMTAHIQYPQVEQETYTSISTGEQVYLPATLSKTILTGILREELGFEGVIITDAMEMAAIVDHFDPRDTARLAINAGVDLILVPVDTYTRGGLNAFRSYIAEVTAMAERGEISMDCINSAVCRVLTLKQKLGLLTAYNGGGIEERIRAVGETVGSMAHDEIAWEIAGRAVTLVKNDNRALPFDREGEHTVIFIPQDRLRLSVQEAMDRLSAEGKLAANTTVEVFSCEHAGRAAMLQAARRADNVLILSRCYSVSSLNPWNAGGSASADIDALIETVHRQGGRAAVLSCYLPYDAARYPSADAILLCYGAGTLSENPRAVQKQMASMPNIPAAVYTAFDRGSSPTAKLPVTIPSLDGNYTFSSRVMYLRGFGLGYTDE